MEDPERLRERVAELEEAGELDAEAAELFYGLADQAEHIGQLNALIDQLAELILRFEDQYGESLPEGAADHFAVIAETAREVRGRVGDHE